MNNDDLFGELRSLLATSPATPEGCHSSWFSLENKPPFAFGSQVRALLERAFEADAQAYHDRWVPYLERVSWHEPLCWCSELEEVERARTLAPSAPIALEVSGDLLRSADGQDWIEGLDLPGASWVHTLDVDEDFLDASSLRDLVASRAFERLVTLRIRAHFFEEDREAIAQGRAASMLKMLDMSHMPERKKWSYIDGYVPYGIGCAGLAAMAASPDLFPQLEHLLLCAHEISDEGVCALAASPLLGRLRTLGLAQNYISDVGVLALAASPHARRLESLSLVGNDARYPITAWVMSGDAFDTWRAENPEYPDWVYEYEAEPSFDVSSEGIGVDGVRALLTSPHLGGLKSLSLPYNLAHPGEYRDLVQGLEAQGNTRVRVLYDYPAWAKRRGE